MARPHLSRPAGTDHRPVIVDLSAHRMRIRMRDALAVYVAAMGYPRGTEQHRGPMWLEHIGRRGWQAVGALQPDSTGRCDPDTAPLLAVGYGYHGLPQQWWYQQVDEGMRRAGWRELDIRAVLGDYFELTELHVHPAAQGRGLGQAMAVRLLGCRPESSVLLSTPEIESEDNRAWRLYRRLGFGDVVRRFGFAGDSRPFAVLGRSLPLDNPPADRW
ncbi:GNAT family N-acetyltransferase [Skermania piniformis]|uniref:GNAT family N-acetyltransferase n=1 Tax=Skermania pinensis TaxID=39122 RepID=A0ABX8SD60_9ACTN|nr:GNAT family N-acetyltransferase [Skermania piniformis]QXQ15087.1 GNAT family N-acetyltransferase [Skermania piniformis]